MICMDLVTAEFFCLMLAEVTSFQDHLLMYN